MAEEILFFSVVPILLETIGIRDLLVVRCASRELCALASEDNQWRNALGKTLILAARWEQTAQVQRLIDRLIVANANLSAMDRRQWSALHHAAERGQDVLVSRLLEAEAEVNHANVDERTPLHIAAANGHLAVTMHLLDRNANVSVKDLDGDTPLHKAVVMRHDGVIRALIAAQADPAARDGRGFTALHHAARNGHSEVVRVLVELGADVAATDHGGGEMTAGLWAVEEWRIHGGFTPLHWASKNGRAETVTVLVELGADVATMDVAGSTALHHAVGMGHEV